MEIIKTNFTDKKEQFNAVNNSKAMKEFAGNVIEVSGYIIYMGADENDEEKKMISFKTTDGEFIGGVSATVIKQFESYLGIFGEIDESNPAKFEITTGKSKSDREFFGLMVK